MEFLPFELKSNFELDKVKTLVAQITFKLLTTDEKQQVKSQYKAMSDEQLRHLRKI